MIKERNFGASGVKPPDISYFPLYTPPRGTLQGPYGHNSTCHYSRHAYCEYCQSPFVKVLGLEGPPSTPIPTKLT